MHASNPFSFQKSDVDCVQNAGLLEMQHFLLPLVLGCNGSFLHQVNIYHLQEVLVYVVWFSGWSVCLFF